MLLKFVGNAMVEFRYLHGFPVGIGIGYRPVAAFLLKLHFKEGTFWLH